MFFSQYGQLFTTLDRPDSSLSEYEGWKSLNFNDFILIVCLFYLQILLMIIEDSLGRDLMVAS